ncbi:MAG: YggS family pyridoxal phosphate-dependent enzyme [Solobacterium sp.]|nr:YggS family pyridoxal phosphate-dependent enzyme [Solobacterium sp.]
MIQKHYEHVKDICGEAELCIVTKKRSIEEIMSYYDAGERVFGENHAAELKKKASVLPQDIRWNFIGHLQTNKVRMIMPFVSMIQSLDSMHLAEVVEKEAARTGRTVDVLAEVHLAEEDTNKSGLEPEELDGFLAGLASLPHLHVRGMMVMGPHTDDEDRIREVFRKAHELFLAHQKENSDFRILSMGMSDDYPLAVQEGSTMVRIGTYLFETGDGE